MQQRRVFKSYEIGLFCWVPIDRHPGGRYNQLVRALWRTIQATASVECPLAHSDLQRLNTELDGRLWSLQLGLYDNCSELRCRAFKSYEITLFCFLLGPVEQHLGG